MNKLCKAGAWCWSFLGDQKTKNVALLILTILTGFGMVAPDTATNMRDTLLALAF